MGLGDTSAMAAAGVIRIGNVDAKSDRTAEEES
jgi:hypothetical protein